MCRATPKGACWRYAAGKGRSPLSCSLSASAEERYLEFLRVYPSIAQRVPQTMLASYLGMTPETVSRIRKAISREGRVAAPSRGRH